jgi:hypothetical protein
VKGIVTALLRYLVKKADRRPSESRAVSWALPGESAKVMAVITSAEPSIAGGTWAEEGAVGSIDTSTVSGCVTGSMKSPRRPASHWLSQFWEYLAEWGVLFNNRAMAVHLGGAIKACCNQSAPALPEPQQLKGGHL